MKKNLFLFTVAWLLNVFGFAQTAYVDSTFTEYFRRTQGWTAGDATLSIPLPNGKVMWLFGDSYIDNYNPNDNTIPCLFQVRNAIMVQDKNDLNSMTTYIDSSKSGINRTYFKLGGNVGNTVLWPRHGFVKKDTVFVFLEKYDGTTYDFLGSYVAKIQLPTCDLISVTALPDMNGMNMGKAFLFDAASGFYYIYGNKLNWIVQEPFVARTKFKNLASGNWTFWTGTTWSKNPTQAKKISNSPVSPGFSVIKIGDFYYLITQDNGYLTCGLGRDIFAYKSSLPTGKFNSPVKLFTIEDQYNGHYPLTYNAQAHPEFFQNNELLISYNVNDRVDTDDPYVCPSQCKNVFADRMNADSYRPKFIRVPLDVFGMRVSDYVERPISLYPNPVTTDLTLRFQSDRNQSGIVNILNAMGQVMLTSEAALNEGDNELQLNVSSLPRGMYFLSMKSSESGDVWKKHKFVK